MPRLPAVRLSVRAPTSPACSPPASPSSEWEGTCGKPSESPRAPSWPGLSPDLGLLSHPLVEDLALGLSGATSSMALLQGPGRKTRNAGPATLTP